MYGMGMLTVKLNINFEISKGDWDRRVERPPGFSQTRMSQSPFVVLRW